MRVTSMCVGDAGLSGAIGFRSGMEGAHPADLMGADALGCAGHSLGTKIGRIRQNAGQHGRDVPWLVARAHMCEVIGKTRPLMHFPQEIRNFDQRIHLADLCIHFFGCRRNVAGGRCDDQRSGFETNTLELACASAIGQALQIEVQHLLYFVQPGSAVTSHTKAKPILFLHRGERGSRHEMLIDRTERAASLYPDIRRAKALAQCSERGNLIEPAIRLLLPKNQFPISRTEMAGRNPLGQCTPTLRMKPSEHRNCCEQGVVAAR